MLPKRGNNMKKVISLALALVMALLLLAGCGHEHTWTEATCIKPKTCKTCGETEGEPLGHTPLEADYWTPSLCAVCGKELGPVQTPGFEQHGLVCAMVPGKTYDYVVNCFGNEEKTTLAKATILNYKAAPAIENYEAVPGTVWNFEAREGYEWRFVTARIVYDDENARKYGWTVGFCHEDYYDIEHHDDTMVFDEKEHDYGKERTFDILYKGKHYDCRTIIVYHSSDWVNRVLTYTFAIAHQVPVGYDGCVVGLCKSSKTWDDGLHIYDIADADSLFFRMN